MRNRTDRRAESNRSPCGIEPIAVRDRTDLRAGSNRSSRGIKLIAVWSRIPARRGGRVAASPRAHAPLLSPFDPLFDPPLWSPFLAGALQSYVETAEAELAVQEENSTRARAVLPGAAREMATLALSFSEDGAPEEAAALFAPSLTVTAARLEPIQRRLEPIQRHGGAWCNGTERNGT